MLPIYLIKYAFVSNIGFRISRWRETELKGNPVQIRNYPRSCKFYPPIVWGSVAVSYTHLPKIHPNAMPKKMGIRLG